MKSHKESYDAVFLTNVPAFYKINLFSEINKQKKILVIFVAERSIIRNENFYNFNFDFETHFLNPGFFETRSKLKTLYLLLKKLNSIEYKKLIFSGWEAKEVTLASLVTRRSKNSIVIESSIIETKTKGIAWLMKKIAMSRMSLAYPSGQLQKAILEKLTFKGKIVITHGVGLSNFDIKTAVTKKSIKKNNPLKFIYIGRLSDEKNIGFIVEVFKKLPYELILVGDGELREQLEKNNPSNIKFLGYIDNEKLSEKLALSDCFILPSLSEPWGLVVEEALTIGVPVIVSNHVGCHSDLVNENNGIVFDVNDHQSFIDAIKKMEQDYEHFASGANEYDAKKMAKVQINAYVRSI